MPCRASLLRSCWDLLCLKWRRCSMALLPIGCRWENEHGDRTSNAGTGRARAVDGRPNEVDIDFFVEEWTKHVGGGLPRQRLAAGSKRWPRALVRNGGGTDADPSGGCHLREA